jgi:glycosyltransferase involved in cell wall biosynthesis
MLTILTPTYNRAPLLAKLHASLLAQTRHDFTWLVVDDGSTDDTQGLVERLAKESPFRVRILRKKNGGKHTALNVAVTVISDELTFIVDSDDTLSPDAVDVVLATHEAHGATEGLCGYSFLRKFQDGTINGKPFPESPWTTDYITARITSRDTQADKAEVYFTRVLKQYPFPEFPGERFLGEDLVWIRIALQYRMVHLNQAIYVGNYLEGGLTNAGKRNKIRSPRGEMARAQMLMHPRCGTRTNLKGAVMFGCYAFLSKTGLSRAILTADRKMLVVAALPLGIASAIWFLRRWK